MSDARGAVTAAQARELTPEEVLDLAERWERLRAHQPRITIGWLYRWITGQSKPPPAEEVAHVAAKSAAAAEQSEARRVESIRYRVVRDGRRLGKPDDEIAKTLEAALVREGFAPEAASV